MPPGKITQLHFCTPSIPLESETKQNSISPYFHQPISDHLSRARRCGLEYLGLLIGRERGVDGADKQLADARAQSPGSLRQNLGARFDLLLPGEEDQDVARHWLGDVRLRLRCVRWNGVMVGWSDRRWKFGQFAFVYMLAGWF